MKINYLDDEVEFIYNSDHSQIAMKYANGVLVCSGRLIVQSGTYSKTETFVIPFLGSPIVTVSNRFSITRDILWSIGNSTHNSVDFFPYRLDGEIINVDGTCEWIAIGRWK